MRVGWLTNLWTPYRHAWWNACAATGIDLTVATLASQERGRSWRPTDDRAYALTAVPSLSVRNGEGRLYVSRTRMPAALRRADVLVLGGWESPSYWQARRWAHRHGVATVGFYESVLASQRFADGPVAAARSAFYRSVDAVLTVGTSSTEALVAAGVDPRRIVTSTNSVDGAGLAAAARAHRTGDAGAGHRYLYVGQLVERKRPDLVVTAFADLAEAHDRLRVVGDGPLRERVEALVERSGRADRIEVVGHHATDQLPADYAWGNTLVMPSETEVWGLVANEALACGLHAVVSERAGVAAAVHGMRGAYPIAPNTSAVAAAMRRSRQEWRGWIDEPAILALGPAEQAERAVEAAEHACRHHAGDVSWAGAA